MKRHFLWLLLVLLAACSAPSEGEKSADEPSPEALESTAAESVELFNGEDLSNWKAFLVDPGVSKEDVWSVRDGLLICKGEPMGYLYTDQEFTSYRLEVEWRWAPGTEPGNSGVLMRISGEPRALPRAIEAQLKSGDAGDVYGFHGLTLTGAQERFTSRQGHELGGDLVGVTKMEGNENPPGEWNRYDIVLDGPRLEVSVNGAKVNEAGECEVLAGPIGLQSEGGEIHFRTVRLTPIP